MPSSLPKRLFSQETTITYLRLIVTQRWLVFALVGMWVITLGILLYVYVALPFIGEIGLPADIEGANTVGIQRTLLDSINEKRVDRLRASPLPFDQTAPRVFGL